MSRRISLMLSLVFLSGLLLHTPKITAQETGTVQVSSGVSYQFLGRWDAAKLNQVLVDLLGAKEPVASPSK